MKINRYFVGRSANNVMMPCYRIMIRDNNVSRRHRLRKHSHIRPTDTQILTYSNRRDARHHQDEEEDAAEQRQSKPASQQAIIHSETLFPTHTPSPLVGLPRMGPLRPVRGSLMPTYPSTHLPTVQYHVVKRKGHRGLWAFAILIITGRLDICCKA